MATDQRPSSAPHDSVSPSRIARTIIAGMDGLIVQYVVDPDRTRADEDLETLIAMIVGAAAVHPASLD